MLLELAIGLEPTTC